MLHSFLSKIALFAAGIAFIGAALFFGSRYQHIFISSPTASLTPVAITPQTPVLNTQGSDNPAGNIDFSDLTNKMSVDTVVNTINQRLHATTNDQDNDGLSNAAEVLIYGTNPIYTDSDIDGSMDGEEITNHTNPLSADNAWEPKQEDIIKQRIAYWGTDFPLTANEKASASRDFVRFSQVGQIRVLLSLYYKDHQNYPKTANWTDTWTELKKADVGGIFSRNADQKSLQDGFFDPLNQAPFVYTYTSSTDGKSFTFSYAFEGKQTLNTYTDTNDVPGHVTRQSLSTTSVTPAPPVTSLKSITDYIAGIMGEYIPVAQAGSVSDAVFTKDGIRVEVYPGKSGSNFNLWPDQIPGWTLAETQDHFHQAQLEESAIVGQAPPSCPSVSNPTACYCPNGVSLVFATNNSQCNGDITVPNGGNVTTGQSFNAIVHMTNTGTSTWRTDDSPTKLGSSNYLWGLNRVGLGSDQVKPGASYDFNVPAVAPTTPGTYNFSWQMLEEGYQGFGPACSKNIIVAAPSPSPSPSALPTPACVIHNAAEFKAALQRGDVSIGYSSNAIAAPITINAIRCSIQGPLHYYVNKGFHPINDSLVSTDQVNVYSSDALPGIAQGSSATYGDHFPTCAYQLDVFINGTQPGDIIAGEYQDAAGVCVKSPNNQPPVAVGNISVNSGTPSPNVAVVRGTQVYLALYANGSSDSDGWNTPVTGVSEGGNCEWNSDLNQGAPTFETKVSRPASPDRCTIILGNRTFNDPIGTYTYHLLRITDASGTQSSDGVVTVQVINPPPGPPFITSFPIPACADKWDNDQDGRIDCQDPACHPKHDIKNQTCDRTLTSEADPQCSDLKDNDGDGLIDSKDPGCHSDNNANNPASYNPASLSELNDCNDGHDNDGDGRIDAADPGCHVDHDIHKTNDGMTNEADTQCSDLKDNDSDSNIDAADPGCHLNNDINQTYIPGDDNESDTVSSIVITNGGGNGGGGGGSTQTSLTPATAFTPSPSSSSGAFREE